MRHSPADFATFDMPRELFGEGGDLESAVDIQVGQGHCGDSGSHRTTEPQSISTLKVSITYVIHALFLHSQQRPFQSSADATNAGADAGQW